MCEDDGVVFVANPLSLTDSLCSVGRALYCTRGALSAQKKKNIRPEDLLCPCVGMGVVPFP